MDSVFINGLLAFVIAFAVFIGSVYLLVALILGPRLGYFVVATNLLGIMAMLSLFWVGISLIPLPQLGLGTALGPKGEETTWHAVGAGQEVTSIEHEYGNFQVGDYPSGDWEAPSDKELVKGALSTEQESEQARPILEGFIADAVSPIPGVRDNVADMVQGSIGLQEGEFRIIDIRMKEATVATKESLIAVAKAVPATTMVAELPEGVEEGTVKEYLVKAGEAFEAGDPVMTIETEGGDIQLPADQKGKLVSFGLRIDDAIKTGVPYASIDVSGEPGAPEPVEVVAVRKIGSLRVPSYLYLAGSTLLFGLHLIGLYRIERPKRAVAQPA